jgi:hypothetical protein
MYWLGFLLSYLAAIAVGWALPVIGVALALPLLQVLFTLQPFVAAGVMVLLGGLLVYYSIHRQAYLEAIIWGALLGTGALTAVVGLFHWYALFLECVLVLLLLIPGVVAPGWGRLLRWFATGELALTLLLIWGQGAGVPGVTLVTAVLLMALAGLIGFGAYRPFEARRIRRRLAGLAAVAAVLLLLWQPVIQPAGQWVGQSVQGIGQAVATSPIGRWYRTIALRAERTEIGEEAKTIGLRELRSRLEEAHKARWEKAIGEVPNLPLTSGEWGELGIPRDP